MFLFQKTIDLLNEHEQSFSVLLFCGLFTEF